MGGELPYLLKRKIIRQLDYLVFHFVYENRKIVNKEEDQMLDFVERHIIALKKMGPRLARE
jgi:hypothetical protein